MRTHKKASVVPAMVIMNKSFPAKPLDDHRCIPVDAWADPGEIR
jgi:hypothetical protein